MVGMAVVHIGDEGKFGSVKASFYPGNPPINYHSKRLDELKEIGYDPPFAEKSRTEANANTAFYVGASSEFDVVAYNENWVAVWSEGGVDESRGSIIDCSGRKDGGAFTSWKPGVYFLPRKNCYILDINNQVATAPKIEAVGKATANLMVKTTPDETDYVKSGVYKINQSVQIVDATPQNGHYKIYYKHGLYYVESKYVNIQLANTEKPLISYKAEANADCDISDGSSVKKGTVIDVEIVPSKVTATIEISSPSKVVPIKIIPKGNVSFGKAISNITSSVESVTIYGDEETLSNIKNIEVEVDVTGLDSTKKYTPTIKKPSGVRYISQTSTNVTIDVESESTKELENIQLEYVNLSPNYSPNANSDSDKYVTVVAKGVKSVLDSITEENVKVYVDLKGYGPGKHEVDVIVEGSDVRVSYTPKVKKVTLIITQKR